MSATVRSFLTGWVGLNKKRQNNVSHDSFGMDATPNRLYIESNT